MKVGIDLVEIQDFKKRSLDVAKIFTETELKLNPTTESLACVFAVKEAFFKALGKKIDWLDVWIEREASGKPRIFSNYLKENERAEVSITHTKDYAAAVVIIFEK